MIRKFQQNSAYGRLKVQAHMLEPVQRVPRYELLLRGKLPGPRSHASRAIIHVFVRRLHSILHAFMSVCIGDVVDYLRKLPASSPDREDSERKQIHSRIRSSRKNLLLVIACTKFSCRSICNLSQTAFLRLRSDLQVRYIWFLKQRRTSRK